MAEKLLFYIWWLFENGLVHCVTFDFLLAVTRINGRRYLPVWLGLNGAATAAVIVLRPPAAFLFSVLFLAVFGRIVLKIPGAGLAAPMAVIVTLCTLKEGFLALLLSWLSVSFRSPTGGTAEQLLVPLLLDALLFAALRTLQRRYPQGPHRSIPSNLCAFLPICTFAVLTVRWGLGLDRADFGPYLTAFSTGARLSALYFMLGTAAVASAAFGAFCRLTCLTERDKCLEDRLKEQAVYVAEAKKRDASYAAFQHDIDNHLLVISGLLRERSFTRAEQYANRLKASSGSLLGGISTGNLALDVLLGEKLSAAKRSHIAAAYEVNVSGFAADDDDLCALFFNILDNAVTACVKEPQENRFLSLSAKVKARFLVIESVNAASAGGPILFGTGLANIRRIAEKYQGTMETELSDGRFRISVLLCSR